MGAGKEMTRSSLQTCPRGDERAGGRCRRSSRALPRWQPQPPPRPPPRQPAPAPAPRPPQHRRWVLLPPPPLLLLPPLPLPLPASPVAAPAPAALLAENSKTLGQAQQDLWERCWKTRGIFRRRMYDGIGGGHSMVGAGDWPDVCGHCFALDLFSATSVLPEQLLPRSHARHLWRGSPQRLRGCGGGTRTQASDLQLTTTGRFELRCALHYCRCNGVQELSCQIIIGGGRG